MLEDDFLRVRRLSARKPDSTIAMLAAEKNVAAHSIATYPALDVVREIPSLSLAANLACLKKPLDDVDVMSAHATLAAEAWAKGDLACIKTNYSRAHALDCLSKRASFAKRWQKSVGDTLAAVDASLKRAGRSVVVIDIGEFLRRGGVPERL